MGRLLQKTFVQVFAKFFKPRTFDHCRGWIFNVMLIAAWPLILFPIDDRWMGGSWCSCVSPVVVPVIKDWVLANICEVVIDMVHCCTAVCILLEGELTSGTHAAAWILHLQSFLRNTTHSQRMLGRHFSFMDGVVVGVQRFSVGVPSDSNNFISALSKWVQLSNDSFAGHMAVTLLLLSSTDIPSRIAWSCQSFLDPSFVLCTKCVACSWLQGTLHHSL